MTEHEEEERVTFLDESSCANLRSDVVAERLQDGSTANKKAMQKEMAAAAKEAKKEAAKAQSSREKKEEQNARAAEKAGDAMRRKNQKYAPAANPTRRNNSVLSTILFNLE